MSPASAAGGGNRCARCHGRIARIPGSYRKLAQKSNRGKILGGHGFAPLFPFPNIFPFRFFRKPSVWTYRLPPHGTTALLFPHQRWIAQCFSPAFFKSLTFCVWFLRPLLNSATKCPSPSGQLRKQSLRHPSMPRLPSKPYSGFCGTTAICGYFSRRYTRSFPRPRPCQRYRSKTNQFPRPRKHLHGTVENHGAAAAHNNRDLFSFQLFTIDGSRRNIPSPEHGASTNLIKKLRQDVSHFSGASLVTQIFPAPNISRFLRSAFARELLISLENRTPVPANFAASSVLLPPGAALQIQNPVARLDPAAMPPVTSHSVPANSRVPRSTTDADGRSP